MTSPITIPLDQLNQAGDAQRLAQLQALTQAYTKAISLREQLAAAANRLKKAGTTHTQTYKSLAEQYSRAKANEADDRRKLDTYKGGQYTPYHTEYTHLTELGGSNPTLDSILGKVTPYDPQSAVDQLNAQAQRENALSQLTQQRQQLNEDYTVNARNAGYNQDSSLRNLLGNYAGRGMAFSSGYGNAVGEQNRVYSDYVGQLASNKQRGLAAADTGQAAAESNYQNMIGQALVGATSRLAGQAGKLGLGSTDLPYYTELARRKLAGVT